VRSSRPFVNPELLTCSNGHYFVYNKEMKVHCQKQLRDIVHIVLEQADSPRELIVPEDVTTALQKALLMD
jgi:hypothetical protein